MLVAKCPSPTSLTFAGEAGLPDRVTGAMLAHLLLAGLTAWQDACLHRDFLEILQLIVDVQVADAAMETGTVPAWPLTQSSSVGLRGHT